MNKQLLFVVAFLFSITFMFSQEFAIGLKGGINNNTIGDINSRGGSFQTGHPDEVFSPDKQMSFLFGAFLDVSFGKLFVRPELNFVDLKNKYEFPREESNWATTKIDLPILIGYKVFEPVSVYLGPGFSFYDEVTLEGANNTHGESNINYYKSSTTLNFGVTVEFKYFGIDLRYQRNMKEVPYEFQDMHYSVYGINLADYYTYNPSMISLSLNIFLFRTDAENVGSIFSGLFKSNKCYCPY